MNVLTLLTKIPKPAGLMGALMLLLAALWFILPLIELNGIQPFASISARMVVISIILLIVLFVALINKILSMPKTPPTEAELAACNVSR